MPSPCAALTSAPPRSSVRTVAVPLRIEAAATGASAAAAATRRDAAKAETSRHDANTVNCERLRILFLLHTRTLRADLKVRTTSWQYALRDGGVGRRERELTRA